MYICECGQLLPAELRESINIIYIDSIVFTVVYALISIAVADHRLPLQD